RNDVVPVVQLLEGDASALLPVVAPVDVIVANIIASIIVPLLPVMATSLRPGGSAVIAGLLASERDAVLGSLGEGGWRVAKEDFRRTGGAHRFSGRSHVLRGRRAAAPGSDGVAWLGG